MTETLAAIQAFAATERAKKGKPPRGSFKPPTLEDLAPGTWLCFDQSIANTGWALLRTDRGLARVMATGMVQVPAGRTPGPKGTLEAVKPLVRALGDVLGAYKADAIIYELPAIAGQRIESSLVAGCALEMAHLTHSVTTPMLTMPRQRAASRLTGKRDAKKPETSAAVNRLVDIWRPIRPWNEHVRDAVLLGLAYAVGGE